MDDARKLRRSTRSRKAVVADMAAERSATLGRKRSSDEAFAQSGSITRGIDILGLPDDLPRTVDTAANAVKVESPGDSIDANVVLTGSNTSIKPETLEREQALFAIPEAAGPHLDDSHLDDDYAPAKQPRKRSGKVKKELSDDEDSMYEKPKRKRVKKEKKPEGPHRLVVTANMKRPRGEKQPPMIYPLEKKPRDPKLPSLLSMMVANFSVAVKKARAKIPRLKPGEQETRLLQYVEEPNDHYRAAVDRAATQRLFVLQRERGVEEDCHANHHDCPIEDILLAGSTGNVYTITITHKPTCTCADYIFRKRNCKHILYVLHNVLKVPEHLKHQNAFLTSELREIAEHAPAIPEQQKQEDNDGNRKPVEDDCPICCMAFEAGEDVVWCQAACGNNVHKQCFEKWAQSRPHPVTCPFCRSEWQKDAPQVQSMTMTEVKMPVFRNSNGYFNVADQLGYV